MLVGGSDRINQEIAKESAKSMVTTLHKSHELNRYIFDSCGRYVWDFSDYINLRVIDIIITNDKNSLELPSAEVVIIKPTSYIKIPFIFFKFVLSDIRHEYQFFKWAASFITKSLPITQQVVIQILPDRKISNWDSPLRHLSQCGDGQTILKVAFFRLHMEQECNKFIKESKLNTAFCFDLDIDVFNL